MVSVTIAGQTPEAVTDVETNSQTGDLGKAVIEVGDTTFNRNTFGSGDKVTISRLNAEDWNGYVTGKPSSSGSGTLEI
jgi:polyisoprenoid-binding protein YceI